MGLAWQKPQYKPPQYKYFAVMGCGSDGNPPTDMHTCWDRTERSYDLETARLIVAHHTGNQMGRFCKPRNCYLFRDRGIVGNFIWSWTYDHEVNTPSNMTNIISDAAAMKLARTPSENVGKPWKTEEI